VYRNPPPDFIRDLDTLPFPARDLVDVGSYRGWFISKKNPQTTMLFARGCPYLCTYCANGIWRTSTPLLRARSPESVVAEMKMLREQYGIQEVYDQADEFNHSLPHALALAKAIRDSGLDMSWQASVRARPMTDELAQAMAESGCWCVSMGIESANAQTLAGIKKKITLDEVVAACTHLRRHNIKVRAHFMLYNVWQENGELRFENSAMSHRNLRFAAHLFRRGLINYITWSVTTPFPGSELYDIAVRHNLIDPALRNDWDGWWQKGDFSMNLPGVTEDERRRMKMAGEMLRVKCMLKNRDFHLKDLPVIVKRGLGLVRGFFAR